MQYLNVSFVLSSLQRKILEDYVQDCQARMDARNKLRDENLNAANSRPDESFFFKMDSSLKKNTAFVKKLVSVFAFFVLVVLVFYFVLFFSLCILYSVI